MYFRIYIKELKHFFSEIFGGFINIESNDNIVAHTYIANTNHPKIKQRIDTTDNTHRVTSGINAVNFKKLFWEVIK